MTPGDPVTVVTRRRVRPGSEAFYEAWLGRLTTDAKALPGYLGAEFHRPATAAAPYVSVFRFDSLANLEAFERSDLRHRYLAEITPHVLGDAVWERLSALEFWFDPPKGTVVPQPSRLRMAILMIGVVFTLVYSIGTLIGLVIGHWPYPVRLAITITIEVFLMTYLIMPRLTRALAAWIYPTTRTVT